MGGDGDGLNPEDQMSNCSFSFKQNTDMNSESSNSRNSSFKKGGPSVLEDARSEVS
jgi:hypothetical protein